MARTLELPDLQLVNATYTLDRGAEPPLFLKASKIAIYDATNRAILTDVHFHQEDDQKGIALIGYADSAEVNTKSYDASLKGSVFVEKPSDQLIIQAHELMYNHELLLLTSVGDSQITLIFEGNKKVVGTSLVADLATLSFSFGSLEEGVLEL